MKNPGHLAGVFFALGLGWGYGNKGPGLEEGVLGPLFVVSCYRLPINPMHGTSMTPMLLPTRFGPDWPGERCGAKTRRGLPCPNPAVAGRSRCRMHGGKGGAPSGPANGRYRHGRFTQQAIATRKARAATRRREMVELRFLEKLGRSIGLFVD